MRLQQKQEISKRNKDVHLPFSLSLSPLAIQQIDFLFTKKKPTLKISHSQNVSPNRKMNKLAWNALWASPKQLNMCVESTRMCLFIVLGTLGGSQQEGESTGRRERGTAQQLLRFLGQLGSKSSCCRGQGEHSLEMCVCFCLLYPVKVVYIYVAMFDRQFT